MLETWKKVWREAAKLMPYAGLVAIRKALLDDDENLLQGATTSPPPLACVSDWTCDGCCIFSWAGWKGNDLHFVGEVEEYFADFCYQLDKELNEPAGSRWFLNWYDETRRPEMIAAMLPEVELALAEMDARAVMIGLAQERGQEAEALRQEAEAASESALESDQAPDDMPF